MPDGTKPADHGPSGLERSLVRSARAALGILYGVVALLGVLHLELWTTLLAVPFFSALLIGLRWSLHEKLHAEAHPPPHELLQDLALEDLVDEWRRSDELFHRTSPADRRAAVEWRGRLLDELERRDPRGFDHWVLAGMSRGPEHHIRAGSDGAATGSDDPTR